MKKLFLFLFTATALFTLLMMNSCNATRTATAYVQQHCRESHIENPLTGTIEVVFQCDSLWNAKRLKNHCSEMNLCVDGRNGVIYGAVVCDSLFSLSDIIKKVLK